MQDRLLRLGAAKLQIEPGQLLRQAQPRSGKVIATGFGTRLARGSRVAQAAPQIKVERQRERGGIAVIDGWLGGAAQRLVIGLPLAQRAGTDADLRRPRRCHFTCCGTRCIVVRHGQRQARVGCAQLLLQPVQHRVLEGLPPRLWQRP
ncbi:hypothetical protein G6F66_014729 [Rhizopus arrhizus]|nr:hypothetical protein G6F66_014729 [Rhizopus arrhizus]